LCAFSFRTQGCGRGGRPAFPAPSDIRKAEGSKQNSRGSRGENAESWPDVIARSQRVAMTAKWLFETEPSRHHPRKRVIQYSRGVSN
jgi:hypothetical protein